MSTVARISGFSPAVLRAWERRHGLLRPERTPGGHRVYGDDDLLVLARIRELLAEGRTIGEIAIMGRKSLLDDGRVARATPPVSPVQRPQPGRPLVESERSSAELACEDTPASPLEHDSALLRAALDLNSAEFDRVLNEAFTLLTPEAAISRIVEPALRRIGELWSQGKIGVSVEHMASAAVMRRLLGLIASSNSLGHSGESPRQAVVACFPDEHHQLGALLVAYYLTRRGARVTYLGASLPFLDLEEACTAIRPDEVHLSVTRQPTFQAHKHELLQLLQRNRNHYTLFVGGRGTEGDHADVEAAGGRLVRLASFADLLAKGLPPAPRGNWPEA